MKIIHMTVLLIVIVPILLFGCEKNAEDVKPEFIEIKDNEEQYFHEDLSDGVNWDSGFSGEYYAGNDFIGEWSLKGALQQSSQIDDERDISPIIISRDIFESSNFTTVNPIYTEDNYSNEQLLELGLSDENVKKLLSPPWLKDIRDYADVLIVTDKDSSKQCKLVMYDINTLYYFSVSGKVFIMERQSEEIVRPD